MSFFPANLPVPASLRSPGFTLRPLQKAVAALDYEAYTASPDVIRAHSGGRWPTVGFTLEEELQQVALHEERHSAKQDFAFTILAPGEAQSLGCVYILPLAPFLQRTAAPAQLREDLPSRTAMVTFWVRQDHQQPGFVQALVSTVDGWLRSQWPFDAHLFRVNTDEQGSIQALEDGGFTLRFDLALTAPPYRYRFYEKPAPAVQRGAPASAIG